MILKLNELLLAIPDSISFLVQTKYIKVSNVMTIKKY